MTTREQEPKDSAAAARARTASLVGQVIQNRYRIEELLAMGGMGAVYRGQHLLMHKRIAIKILHPDTENLPELVARFEREAVAGAHVQHPNVAAVSDFGVLDDGSYFLVLEYVRGITLSDLMRQGPVPPRRALEIARQLASALASAHAMGIVHRDVKPRNVMLVEGKADVVKLIDFGLAKLDTERLSTLDAEQAAPRLTVGGVIFGTIAYLAPEAALGMDVVDARSDLYALGVILYEMLAGEHLFGAVDEAELFEQHRTSVPRSLRELFPEAQIPEALEAVVMRLLEKQPARRYAGATELIAALDAVAPAVGVGDKKAVPSLSPPISASAFTVAGVPSLAAPSLAALEAPDVEATSAKPIAAEKPAAPAKRRSRGAKRTAPAEAQPARGQAPTRSREVSRFGIAAALVVGALAVVAFTRDCGQTGQPVSPAEPSTQPPPPASAELAAPPPTAAPSAAPDPSTKVAPAPPPSEDTPEIKEARAQLLKSAATKRWDPGAAALATLAERAPGSLGARALIGAARDVAEALERHPSPQTERIFSALEHDFGTDGLDVLYGLVESNGAGLGGRRALASLRDPAVLSRATPALRIAFALREVPCNEKLDLLDRAVAEGDARTLGVLQTFGRGCFPKNKLVEGAIASLRAKLPKGG